MSDLNKGTWRTYTTADGLAALQVEHIVEDDDGYLWFATCSGGVSRFDGDEFSTYTTRDGLCSDLVYGMLCDRQGRLWFGTLDRGVCWYDGRSFHRFGEDEWVSRESCTYLFEDEEGRIWVGGADALGYYDGTAWRDLLPEYRQTCGQDPGRCWGITQDGNGHLWFGGRQALARFDGACFHRYGKEDGLVAEGASYAVAADGEGDLWVGNGKRIWRHDGHTFQPVPVELAGQVRKIQTDREGRTWVCSVSDAEEQGDDGALCYDGGEWHRFDMSDGLAFGWVCGMLQDREGQFWFATLGGGVSCYDPHSIHSIGEEDGLPYRQVHTLTQSRRGEIWMGFSGLYPARSTPRSVGIFDGEFAALKAQRGHELDLGTCRALCADRSGSVWVGSARGLYRHEDGSLRKVFPEEESEERWVTAIVEDDAGQMFFGHVGLPQTSSETGPAITCFDGSEFRQGSLGYRTLRFAFHPGETTLSGAERFTVAVDPGRPVILLQDDWVDMTRREWQVVEIPLGLFETDEPYYAVSFGGSFGGTFYLDAVELLLRPEDADLVILADAVSPGWETSRVGLELLAPSQTDIVHAGSTACAVQGTKSFSAWTVKFQPADPVYDFDYETLRFAIHPGETALAEGDRLSVRVAPGVKLVNLTRDDWVDMTRREWQVVEIPLADFLLHKPIEAVTFSGNFAGVFYLDDLALGGIPVPPRPPTAVLETHVDAVPQAFTLQQNCPNPFNSDTVIGFALPTAAEVELTLYSVTGQRVVSLAQGWRPAGTHTVRWDGRDDAGRALASGVYLYRLRVGTQQVATRRLLLLR